LYLYLLYKKDDQTPRPSASYPSATGNVHCDSTGTLLQDILVRTSFRGPSPSRGRGLPKREPSSLSTSTPVTPSTIGDQRKPSGVRRAKEDGGAQGRKLHLSKMKERQLDTIYPTNFHKTCLPIVDYAPTTSSISLRNYITEGASEDVWREFCTTYTSFFNGSESSTEPSVPVPLLLRPLFRHLRTTKKEHINLLSNGEGKLFVAAMFPVWCSTLVCLGMAADSEAAVASLGQPPRPAQHASPYFSGTKNKRNTQVPTSRGQKINATRKSRGQKIKRTTRWTRV
jgi:hypothetical protein